VIIRFVYSDESESVRVARHKYRNRYDIAPCYEERGRWYVVDTESRYARVKLCGSRREALRESYRFDRVLG
jgi:hypothetical protein